jgi:thiol-disulfide isomerase/thioredoxin
MKRRGFVGAARRCALGLGIGAGAIFLAGGMDMTHDPAVQAASAAQSQPALDDEGAMPEIGNPGPMPTANDKERFMPEKTVWLNSPPLNTQSLRGKVVLVDFWTYSCINSLRNLPYVQAWAEKYKAAGLVVIGVHTPEFGFETLVPNVTRAVAEYNVAYPVAIDSNYRIWQAFNNDYWPADYFIDGRGRIRYHHYGEGDYLQSERVIQELLAHNGATGVSGGAVHASGKGAEAPAGNDEQSPETYVGLRRQESFVSPERPTLNTTRTYTAPAKLAVNQWGLAGSWNIGPESGVLQSAPGTIVFRFHSRDLHFVLGPTSNGKPVRFKVTLEGAPPGSECGVDCAPDGSGIVREPRLYQLIRQKGEVKDRTFAIEFLDPGVHAYVFTFG